MAKYTYNNVNIDHEILVEALQAGGVKDAVFVLHGNDLEIDTATSKAIIDTIVNDADANSLFYKKEIKKQQVRAKTHELVDIGVESWVTGKYVALTQKTANGYYEDWTYLTNNPSKISATQPYILMTKDDDEISTALISDIKALADRCADRWSIIIDGQKDLIDAIDGARDETELNAVTDTRT